MQCCAIWCIGAVSSALLRRDETGDNFAGPSECWLETGVAFARVGRASTETAIAFVGEKWVFLVRFSVALVMVVSAGAVQGRAVVMAVSCWPTSVPAEVSLVSTSPSGRVLCTKKFTLLGLMVGASAKKFALQAQNGRKTLFSGALGEFFRGRAGGGAVLGEFCRTNRYCARSCRQRSLPACNGGGFALHEAVAQRVASVSDPHVVQFPPLLSAACGFVCAPGFPRVLMGAHTFSLRSRNVTVSQVCSRHIQCRLCHRIRAGTPAQSASITSTTTRP